MLMDEVYVATRELTSVLLEHDHGVKWWIPDGQLCPTVPNRSNYIHWIEDLLSSDVIAKTNTGRDKVRGFDIGTEANCIYPLLGASLMGWSFVGPDVTDVALEWAKINVKSNPHLSELIEIRKAVNDEGSFSRDETAEAQLACSELIEIRNAGNAEETLSRDETFKDQLAGTEIQGSSEASIKEDVESLTAKSLDVNSDSKDCKGQLVLVGVVKDDETGYSRDGKVGFPSLLYLQSRRKKRREVEEMQI